MQFTHTILYCALTSATALTTNSQPLTDSTNKEHQHSWTVRGGVSWRQIGSTSLDYNQSANAGSNAYYMPNADAGSATEYADRNYDDGYVGIGAATDSTGLTTNFGYQSDSQIHQEFDQQQNITNTLSYTSSGGIALAPPTQDSSKDQTAAAPYLELAYFTQLSDHIQWGLSINVSYLNLDQRIQSAVQEYEITIIDTYELDGVYLPQAPYDGSYSGPGPTIENIPDKREEFLTETGTQINTFNSQLDLYSIALGSEIAYLASERLSFQFGAGAVLNYADWEAEIQIAQVDGPFHASSSGNEFLFGLYLKAGTSWQLTQRTTLEAFVRYDWNQALSEHVGEAQFETELSGWATGLAIAYKF
jgi:hypothetical protein